MMLITNINSAAPHNLHDLSPTMEIVLCLYAKREKYIPELFIIPQTYLDKFYLISRIKIRYDIKRLATIKRHKLFSEWKVISYTLA